MGVRLESQTGAQESKQNVFGQKAGVAILGWTEATRSMDPEEGALTWRINAKSLRRPGARWFGLEPEAGSPASQTTRANMADEASPLRAGDEAVMALAFVMVGRGTGYPKTGTGAVVAGSLLHHRGTGLPEAGTSVVSETCSGTGQKAAS